MSHADARENDAKVTTEVGIEPALAARLFRILSQMTPDERTHAWVQANQFIWPDAVAQFKPMGWDLLESPRKYDNLDGKTLLRCLESVTSDYDRSRQWNIEIADNNEKRHREWYIETHFSEQPSPTPDGGRG